MLTKSELSLIQTILFDALSVSKNDKKIVRDTDKHLIDRRINSIVKCLIGITEQLEDYDNNRAIDVTSSDCKHKVYVSP